MTPFFLLIKKKRFFFFIHLALFLQWTQFTAQLFGIILHYSTLFDNYCLFEVIMTLPRKVCCRRDFLKLKKYPLMFHWNFLRAFCDWIHFVVLVTFKENFGHISIIFFNLKSSKTHKLNSKMLPHFPHNALPSPVIIPRIQSKSQQNTRRSCVWILWKIYFLFDSFIIFDTQRQTAT